MTARRRAGACLATAAAVAALAGCANSQTATDDAFGAQIAAAATHWVQTPTPTVWGGGNQHGPTAGVPEPGGDGPATTPGFDASGLTQYAVYQGSGGTVLLPHFAGGAGRGGQVTDPRGHTVALGQVRPGDLVFADSNGTVYTVGVYVGAGQVVAASDTGNDVARLPLQVWAAGNHMQARRFG